MKKMVCMKNLIMGVTFFWVMGNAFKAEAATGLFDEVPLDDWSYQAVNHLISTENLADYKRPLSSQYTVSRMEMALIVNEALENKQKFSMEDQDEIIKLSDEYTTDIKQIQILDKLNQRDISKTEKKSKDNDKDKWTDKISFYGSSRVRYQESYTDKGTSVQHNHIQVAMNTDIKITDKWKLHMQNTVQRSLKSANSEIVYADGRTTRNDTQDGLAQNEWGYELSLAGPVGPVDMQVGRWNEYSMWGHGMDGDISVVQASFGKKLRTTIQTGKAGDWSGTNSFDTYHPSVNYSMLRLAYQTSKATKVEIATYKIDSIARHYQAGNGVNYQAFSIYSNFSPKWKVMLGGSVSNAKLNTNAILAALGRTNTSTGPAWGIRFNYGDFDKQKKGSHDVFLTYHNEPYLAQYNDTDWWTANARGFRIGADYTIDKNVVLWGYYTIAQDIDTSARRNAARIELDVYF